MPSIEWAEVDLRVLDENRLSINASGKVQDRIWAIKAVDYKAAFTAISDQTLCTVAAIADAGDLGG
jgi:hypothetical protein